MCMSFVPLGVPVLEASECSSVMGRRGARKAVPSHKPCEHAAAYEPPPMNPLVRKGIGEGEDGWGVAWVREEKENRELCNAIAYQQFGVQVSICERG